MTLGMIGEGVLGQRVAEIAKAFGMRVLFAAHKGREGLGPLYTPWDEVLASSDVIAIHSPLTPQTRGMLALPEFRAMKRKPLIINKAHGGLVDEEALVRALDEGWISGIGFDELSGEPPAENNPLMKIAGRPNVIVTPHVAWASDEAQQSLADQLMDKHLPLRLRRACQRGGMKGICCDAVNLRFVPLPCRRRMLFRRAFPKTLMFPHRCIR
ncbi:Glyoxylate/hydroxypyruvate reductase B [Paraburkholderia caffeinitolerans]|uniref:Glyoxylate/hydroxypyruvate reductase B n=2 Tax=Paraburkholderia caffeinitolerans TaxID=1723730 RepID=A0A6J5G7C6_9BURK|nr:Glyoxylate/hydroxypyruvate reductase B [Paraburkholderia caffeinitolerans]